MQNIVKNKMPFKVEIEATAHGWRMPFVALFESLFRAGDAVRLGKTILYVKDKNGVVVHEEYYGKSRKAAWYRQLDIEKQMSLMNQDEFIQWLKEERKL